MSKRSKRLRKTIRAAKAAPTAASKWRLTPEEARRVEAGHRDLMRREREDGGRPTQ